MIVSCQQKEGLTVAASANMQGALVDIISVFEKQYNVEVDLVVGSSGKLTSQIEQGAPFDVFFSADNKYPNYLNQKGLTRTLPRNYAQGQLVLWHKSQSKNVLSDLITSKGEIAIANPDLAPYGEATLEVLKNWRIYEKVQSRLVYGENVSQVNQFMASGAVDFAFTALSTFKTDKLQGQDNYLVLPDSLYTPILQSGTLIKTAEIKLESQLFFNFMFSDTVKQILIENGYLIPDE